jgi:hypothetical protein
MILGLPAAQLVIGGAPDRRWLLFAAVSWAAGGALVWWGWSRLRAAKADHPGLTWRQFLRDDLIALGIVAVLCAALAATPRSTRDDLTRSLLEFVHRLHVARGGP